MASPRIAALLAVLGLSLLASCGSDDEGDGAATAKPTEIAVNITGKGPNAKVDIPASVKAGLVEFTFQNGDKVPHDAQVIRIEGDHTLEEVEEVEEVVEGEGTPTPDWIKDGGGLGTVGPGQTGTAIEVLEPGRHVVFDTENGGKAEFEVTGEAASAQLPATDASLKTVEYGFETSGLKAGRNTLTFKNEGEELHHVIAAPINEGTTIEEVKKFASSDEEPSGPPPIDFEKVVGTAVLDGGREQVTELELQKGRYALLCFISDRAGGPPHTAKGMVQEVKVSG